MLMQVIRLQQLVLKYRVHLCLDKSSLGPKIKKLWRGLFWRSFCVVRRGSRSSAVLITWYNIPYKGEIPPNQVPLLGKLWNLTKWNYQLLATGSLACTSVLADEHWVGKTSLVPCCNFLGWSQHNLSQCVKWVVWTRVFQCSGFQGEGLLLVALAQESSDVNQCWPRKGR
jgi:hypothetical protein